MDADQDVELTALRAEYSFRWHVTRTRSGYLDAAREPRRGYHVLAGDARELAASIAIADRNGTLVKRREPLGDRQARERVPAPARHRRPPLPAIVAKVQAAHYPAHRQRPGGTAWPRPPCPAAAPAWCPARTGDRPGAGR